MTESVLDTITVTETCFEDVRSTSAEVRVALSERSLGRQSSGSIARVRARVLALGLDEGDVRLEGIEHTSWAFVALLLAIGGPIAAAVAGLGLSTALAVGAGFVLLYAVLAVAKVGTVTASMRILCVDASTVGRLLDVVLDERSAELRSIDWRYDVPADTRGDWVAEAIARGHERAERIADALGVRLAGVHALHEVHTSPQPTGSAQAPMMEASLPARRARSSTVAEGLGAAPSATERAGVTVHIQYRIEPRPTGE